MFRKISLYNLISGLIGQLLTIVVAILVPRLVLVNLGSESNGLLNSVNQALVYLSLMEAGVGTVTIQALYKPIASNDKQSINKILTATSLYYKKTGVLYTFAVIIFSITYPCLVRTEIPTVDVIFVILFSGMAGALGYFFQGKYRLMLQAEGKSYILSNLTTTTHILINLGKILLLLAGYDVVALQLLYFILTIGQILYIHIYIKRHYKWLNLEAKPAYDAISQKSSVLVHQVCGLIFNNTDSMILTLVRGLKTVSVYSIYSMLYTQIGNFAGTLTTGSVMFALGQTYNTNRQKFECMYETYEVCTIALNSALFCIAYIFITPFLLIYTTGVDDIKYVDTWYNILFCTVYLLSSWRGAAQTIITVAGHFQKTQRQAVIETIINLIVTFILVFRYSINGALLGTIVALLYRTNEMILYANHKILGRKAAVSYCRILRNFGLLLAIVFVAQYTPLNATSYTDLILSVIIYTTIIITLFAAANIFTEKKIRKFIKELLYNNFVRKDNKKAVQSKI